MTSKPTLALLHGWGMNPRVFDALHAPLEKHCTLLPLALPGHGGTSAFASSSLTAWAAHLAAQLPPQTILLGWSLGGQIAMRMALDHPATMKRLILVSTTPKFVADTLWPAGIAREDLLAFGADMQTDTRATLLRFLSLQTRGAVAQKTLLQTLRAAFLSELLPDPQAMAAGLDMLLHTDLRAETAQLTQPTLVIHGSLDKLTPPAAGDWLAKNLPSAKSYSIDGAAHAPFLSHTQLVAEAIVEALHD